MFLEVLGSLFFPVLKAYVMIYIGYLLQQKGYIDKTLKITINKLVLDILLPMFFFARIGISFNIHSLPAFLLITLDCSVYFSVCYFGTDFFLKIINCPEGFKNKSKGLVMIGNYIIMPLIIGESQCKPYGIMG